MLLARLLDRMIHLGQLTVIDADGRPHVFKGSAPGPQVTIRLHDRALHRKLFFRPMLATGEAYMDGTLTIEDGADIYDFIELASMNIGFDVPDHWFQRLLSLLNRGVRRVAQYNPAPIARRNVAHHYDLSDRLYELFLDSDRQYSCAYFRNDTDDLETAQWQKKTHLAAKLLLRSGQRVLDIGSGWGGLGLHLAGVADVDVTGVTLSQEQHKVSNARAAEAALADRVRFQLTDYRDLTGRFDRIVSVGMFEHVGVGYYDAYFTKLRQLLADDGIAVVHTIGRADGPGSTNPWIRKYIFPGGYSPALSEILPAIERQRFYVTDVEVLKLHYAKTLRAWRTRFTANRQQISELYDERFCRMWEFYLAGSECAFRYNGHVVFQIQIAGRADAVPETRDYIHAFEEAQQPELSPRRRASADSQAA